MSEHPKQASLQRLAEHRSDLVALADTLRLWRGCENNVCRRKGKCRGLVDEILPRCTLRLLHAVRRRIDGCIDFYKKPVPPKPVTTRELTERMGRLIGMFVANMEKREEEDAD